MKVHLQSLQIHETTDAAASRSVFYTAESQSQDWYVSGLFICPECDLIHWIQ